MKETLMNLSLRGWAPWLLAGALMTAGGIYAFDGQSSELALAESPPIKPARSAATVSKFSVFGRPQTEADRGRPVFGGPASAVDEATTRKLDVGGGRTAWAATGDRTCVAATSQVSVVMSAACVDPAIADAQGVWSISRPAPSDVKSQGLPPEFAEITALLPDGISQVIVKVGDRRVITEPVRGNAMSVGVSENPKSASWTNANGVKQTLKLGLGE